VKIRVLKHISYALRNLETCRREIHLPEQYYGIIASRGRPGRGDVTVNIRMKVLVQRVSKASVSVNNSTIGKIGRGLVVFLGVARGDSEGDARYLANRVASLRIFADAANEIGLSALEIGGEMLVISQFTLLADLRKGRRPSFTQAAPANEAKGLYEFFLEQLRATGLRVDAGLFREHMLVEIHNDGPVTLLLESKQQQ
jgi:D-aminoacyl-tRNA deacylase